MKERYRGSAASRQATREAGASDAELLREAETIEQQLHLIQREMRRAIEADQRKTALTAPQTQAMMALVQQPDGLTLKELSARMGLAHSTVSGIVDRLERQGLVRRQTNAADRRCTRIAVTERVEAYIQQRLPEHLHGPLLAALRRATSAERAAILTGLSTLRQLLMAQGRDQA